MRGTPYKTIVNRYWRLVMWNRVGYAQDYMACRVIGVRDRKYRGVW